MSINYRIAQEEDKDLLYAFAESQLKKSVPDEMELMMKVWESPFRKEALDHYLKMGWSFLAYDENASSDEQRIKGFFLGQPLLFFECQTQTLWVEMIVALDFKVEAQLAEIAIKLSKDKHFQKVILPKSVVTLNFEKPFTFQNWSDRSVFLKTTK